MILAIALSIFFRSFLQQDTIGQLKKDEVQKSILM